MALLYVFCHILRERSYFCELPETSESHRPIALRGAISVRIFTGFMIPVSAHTMHGGCMPQEGEFYEKDSVSAAWLPAALQSAGGSG
jgi:hypothetical protein